MHIYCHQEPKESVHTPSDSLNQSSKRMAQMNTNSSNSQLVAMGRKMMALTMGHSLAESGTSVASLIFILGVFQQFFPNFFPTYFQKLKYRLFNYFFREVRISFPEYSSDRFRRSDIYTTIETYLSSKSTKSAYRLKADTVKKREIVLAMDDREEIVDVYDGVTLKWFLSTASNQTKSISLYSSNTEKRAYVLKFRNKHRQLVTKLYLPHVMEQGRALEAKQRQRRIYTNNPRADWQDSRCSLWSKVVFDHPATFDTLAIDSKMKEEIMFDLTEFSKGKKYYEKMGKAWKRGYLLYGPPGTGKSTMIAAIANYMHYDVYDIELTTIKDNSELRKILINISSKALIVIEDIDCSLDLTGQRKKKKGKKKDGLEEESGDRKSEVTLSGLLNFIDGIWSASGGERIILFTTNDVEKLDPALIRRGRMDKHIELSYCGFEAFKILAKNILGIESHPLFETIGILLEENKMTPADVVENLTPKSFSEAVESSLENLIQALKKLKKEASSEVMEEVSAEEVEG